MIEWNNIVIGLSLLLLAFLIFSEVWRQKKARLGWRLLATTFAVASLACIAIPITYRHTERVDVNHEAVLLTEGFYRDSLNKFLSVNYTSMPVLTLEKNLADAGKYNASYISDVSLLSQQYKDINTYHVFGYGLEKDELDSLKNLTIVFHPTALAKGITSINWSRKIKTGERLFIQGVINNTSPAKATVVLKSFSTTLDSIPVSIGKNQTFQLTTIPKHQGRSLYSITVLAGKDTIENELVPVQVEQGEPLKVLMLSSSPDFENKFLKNFLAQNGFKVVSRTAISKNKFVKDFLNTPVVPIERITTSLLEKVDVTIADAAELRSISRPELAVIQSQVARKSMGLIVRADSAAPGSFYAGMFPVTAVFPNSPQHVNLSFSDSTGRNMPAINLENLLFIRNQQATLPLISDRQNRSFASIALYGSGKIILTTLNNTYSWPLSGFQNDYYSFWSHLLNNATANSSASEAWSISPALPQVDKRVQLLVQANKSDMPQGQVDATSVYLGQDPDLTYQWTGTYYPTKEGWKTGIQTNGEQFYWYAYNKNEWKNIKASEKIEETKRLVNRDLPAQAETKKKLATIDSEVPKALFLLLFLLFAGFLWFENKM